MQVNNQQERRVTHTSTTDVLIVGAGPTGLTLACELLSRGVTCRLIEQLAEPVNTSRALAIHSRTLEVFETMGIVNRVLSAGHPLIGATLHERDNDLLRLDLDRLNNVPYPFLLVLPQQQTERILRERLTELGGTILRSRSITAISHESNGVLALVEHADTSKGVTSTSEIEVEEVHAQWIVGCDGAHSSVRKLLDIPFAGKALAVNFLLADVDFNWTRSRNTTHAWLSPQGLFVTFPLPSGQWRIVADMAPTKGQHSIPDITLELVQQTMVERTRDHTVRLSNPTWLSNFIINTRMVQQYRVGRVFLAGDAAHIHSPFGGQGMNIGIQDAFNLAWKLALVIQNKASAQLLDSYQEERLPVAKGVLKGTELGTDVVIAKNPLTRIARNRIILPLLKTGYVQQRLGLKASQLPINYRASSLSRMWSGLEHIRGPLEATSDPEMAYKMPLEAGDRAPQALCVSYPQGELTSLFECFQGTASHLLLFPGAHATAEGYRRLVRIAQTIQADPLLRDDIHAYVVVPGQNEQPSGLTDDTPRLLDPQSTIHAEYGARKETLYYIRPDGYIGFRSRPANAEKLYRYLARIFKIAPAAQNVPVPERRAHHPV